MIDFLGIGAQRSGTTWLNTMLKQHPNIWTPLVKEVHFFDTVHLDLPTKRRLRIFKKRAKQLIKMGKRDPDAGIPGKEYLKRVADPAFAFSEEWYRFLFSVAPAQSTKGEITPLYCAIGQAGIQHVKRVAPDVKLLYMVRDPVSRAISSVKFHGRLGTRMQKRLVRNELFQARGDYAKNIPEWDAAFPGKIFYAPFGRIKTDPQALLSEVEEFLRLPPCGSYVATTEQVHSAGGGDLEPDIVERLETICAPQYPFLRDRFGEEFVSRLR